MATPQIMYGSETWTDNRRQNSQIQAAEMRFLRRVKGCTRLDRYRNEDIRQELNIYRLTQKIKKIGSITSDVCQKIEKQDKN